MLPRLQPRGLVAEPELAAILPSAHDIVGRAGPWKKRRNTSILLRAFRSLMPRDERFIERFCEHSKLIVPAAEAFRALMSDDGQAGRHTPPKSRAWKMHGGGGTGRTVLANHRTFVTPFDRSQIWT